MTGAIAWGTRLPEDELAANMNVSRGPVREALVRLAQEGLVTIERFKGAKVAELYREDIDQLFSLRQALESLAVDWACTKAQAADLDALYALLARFGEVPPGEGSADFVAYLDIQFHEGLVRAAHHDRLYRAWEGIRSQVSSFLNTRLALRADYVDTWESDHRVLVDMIREKRKAEATAYISHHIEESYDRVVRAMEHRE